MAILDEQVQRYLHELRPERSEVMAEMEAVAERDSGGGGIGFGARR